ncbi:hypothetical protein B7P34_02690 [Streptosporangium nondiastaticum]|uniref:Peptidase n=1 Tax=Streptosporangium nondiastaticum TaxID=35764 RepID=A0A9X7JV36_9ACTN|nr:hypothetical protein [Streptosporangium nondiastaticum]PSJ30291.1 hypothetical protein B7P34_02690 [Streptosporangium nondiastaticum]
MRLPLRAPAARAAAAGLLAAAALFTSAGAAAAASPSPSASAAEDSAPTEAGTGFRTATVLKQGQKATADASTGDYLYWQFPAGAGQQPQVKATVNLPEASARHGAAVWQIDVYDGLRRRQACASGEPTQRASERDASVTLTCTLRTVRPWAERWANDPLPGAYYIRLTLTEGPDRDHGLPVKAEVEATAKDAGGARAEGGEVAPLHAAAVGEPEDGWNGSWWSDRWAWTVGGAVLGALAAIGGYVLTRHPRRPARQ